MDIGVEEGAEEGVDWIGKGSKLDGGRGKERQCLYLNKEAEQFEVFDCLLHRDEKCWRCVVHGSGNAV